MLFVARGDFHGMTPLRRVHRIGDVGALGETRRLGRPGRSTRRPSDAARAAPRRARDPRRPPASMPRCRRVATTAVGMRRTTMKAGFDPARCSRAGPNALAGRRAAPLLRICAAAAPHKRAQRGLLRAPRGHLRGRLRMLRELSPRPRRARASGNSPSTNADSVADRAPRANWNRSRRYSSRISHYFQRRRLYAPSPAHSLRTLRGPSVSNTRMCSRARESRDITVPIGTPSALDAS